MLRNNAGASRRAHISSLGYLWLICTVIKFHIVEEAKEAVLYFVQDF